ncbi:hypothetical protein BGX34_010189 [Mortierella sp. NVP85]|nr:hypothetical protein BGX34_010189 [Mortierella sp. NVP85]
MQKDEHAKRKRDELEALEKQASAQASTVSGSDTDTQASKKMQVNNVHSLIETNALVRFHCSDMIYRQFSHAFDSKPETEAGTPVSKAEVKQIQRDLKTMPLEDGQNGSDAERQAKDMEEVESDHGSNEDATEDMESSQLPAAKTDTPDGTGSTPSSDIGDQEAESANTTALSTVSDKNGTEVKSSSKDTTESAAPPKSSLGGFSNTSTVSPFASVKPGGNVFGSSSTTLQGFNAASTVSPFAAVEKTNIFDTKPTPLSGGFGNTSSASPFATAGSSTNIFGGDSTKRVFGSDSAKSVFGQSSVLGNSTTTTTTTTAAGFGLNSEQSTDSTAGSVFGAKSVIGSTAGATGHIPPAFTLASESSSSPFSTFGAKHSFGKESSFTSGSFIDHESSQEKTDFGSLLSQDTGEHDDDPEHQGDDHNYASSQFYNADQIDGKFQTGEEDEVNIYQTKGKLYADVEKTHSWKERGKGTFRINVNMKDTSRARLVMRTDGVLRLILNVAIFPEMNAVITGEKYVRFVGIEDGTPIPFLLKVKDAQVANEVVDNIKQAADRQSQGNRSTA